MRGSCDPGRVSDGLRLAIIYTNNTILLYTIPPTIYLPSASSLVLSLLVLVLLHVCV